MPAPAESKQSRQKLRLVRCSCADSTMACERDARCGTSPHVSRVRSTPPAVISDYDGRGFVSEFLLGVVWHVDTARRMSTTHI